MLCSIPTGMDSSNGGKIREHISVAPSLRGWIVLMVMMVKIRSQRSILTGMDSSKGGRPKSSKKKVPSMRGWIVLYRHPQMPASRRSIPTGMDNPSFHIGQTYILILALCERFSFVISSPLTKNICSCYNKENKHMFFH